MEQFAHVGENLRKARGDKTQKTVAEDNNISVSSVAMYEAGERMPRDEIKVKLANYFGKSVEELFFTPELHQ